MKNKKLLIIISSIILLIIACCVIFFWIKIRNNNLTEPKEESPNKVEEIEFIRNENFKIYEKHCLENFCTSIEDFIYREGYGGFSILILNNSDSIITQGFKNIVLKTSNGLMKKFFYHDDLNPGETFTTEITFTEEDIIYATDYELEEPTLEETMNYYSNMLN